MITIGTIIVQRATVKERNSNPIFGKSLDKGTKFVNITKNITSVNTIVERKGILYPSPIGKSKYKRDNKAIATPGIIKVAVTVDPVLLISIENVTSVKAEPPPQSKV